MQNGSTHIDASMATLRPKSVFISCSFIAAGACSLSSPVRPLIPMVKLVLGVDRVESE